MIIDDLATALEQFTPDMGGEAEELIAAAENAIKELQEGAGQDLTQKSDQELIACDSAHLARLTYVLAYLRMMNFLRHPQQDPDMQLKQATVGLNFVKHCESTGMKAMQLGRDRGDKGLAKEVSRLRDELSQVSTDRAKVIMDAEFEEAQLSS